MKQKDTFKILSTATEIMHKHLQLNAIVLDTDVKASLDRAYKTAVTALLMHTNQAVAQIKTISELSDIFVDSCYAFGAVGMRKDLIQNKLLGVSKSGHILLFEAVTDDTISDDALDCIPEFFKTESGDELGTAYNLCCDAYSDYNYFTYPSSINKKTLSLVYLIHHCHEQSINLDLAFAAQELQHCSCLNTITNMRWSSRSLVGYSTANSTYVINDVNHEFISLFADKLKSLLSDTTEYFDVLQIKQHLQEHVLSVYAESSSIVSNEIYSELDKLIGTVEGITESIVDELCYSKRFVVTKKYSDKGISYELNYDGLQSLVATLVSLDLQTLPEANVFINKVKSVCN